VKEKKLEREGNTDRKIELEIKPEKEERGLERKKATERESVRD
jgi:hypothetical protein